MDKGAVAEKREEEETAAAEGDQDSSTVHVGENQKKKGGEKESLVITGMETHTQKHTHKKLVLPV